VRTERLDTIVPLRLSFDDEEGRLIEPDDENFVLTLYAKTTPNGTPVAQGTPGEGVTTAILEDGLRYALVDLGNANLKNAGFFANGNLIQLAITDLTVDSVSGLGGWVADHFKIGEPGDIEGSAWLATVTVKRSSDGEAIPGALVTFRRLPDVQKKLANESGVAAKYLPEGDWIAVGTSTGFSSNSHSFSIDGGDDVAFDLLLDQVLSSGTAPMIGLLTGLFIARVNGVATDGVRYRYKLTQAPTEPGHAVDTATYEAESATVDIGDPPVSTVGVVSLANLLPTSRVEVQDVNEVEPPFEFGVPAEDDASVNADNEFFVPSFKYRRGT
jgi:hypothetical protein